MPNSLTEDKRVGLMWRDGKIDQGMPEQPTAMPADYRVFLLIKARDWWTLMIFCRDFTESICRAFHLPEPQERAQLPLAVVPNGAHVEISTHGNLDTLEWVANKPFAEGQVACNVEFGKFPPLNQGLPFVSRDKACGGHVQ